MDPTRFAGDGGWADLPEHWVEAAERRMEAGKLADRIRVWIGELPARQREVVLLRDVEGMSSEEVCAVLALTEGNQRVLLHRGRSLSLTGRIEPEDLTPQMRDEFTDLYRRWRSEYQ